MWKWLWKIASGTWDHIGGISSVLLSKEQGAQLTRLHGPVDIKHFLECIRPFTDSDFVLAKYPAPVSWKFLSKVVVCMCLS